MLLSTFLLFGQLVRGGVNGRWGIHRKKGTEPRRSRLWIEASRHKQINQDGIDQNCTFSVQVLTERRQLSVRCATTYSFANIGKWLTCNLLRKNWKADRKPISSICFCYNDYYHNFLSYKEIKIIINIMFINRICCNFTVIVIIHVLYMHHVYIISHIITSYFNEILLKLVIIGNNLHCPALCMDRIPAKA